MKIIYNGMSREVADGATVASLLDELELVSRHVAVEVNLEVVPRALHADRLLAAGDQLEVVTLVGGG